MHRGSQARPPRCSAYRAPGALLIADAASRAGRSRSALCHAVCLASSLILRLPSSPFSTLRHPSASPKCFTSHLLPPAASPRPPHPLHVCFRSHFSNCISFSMRDIPSLLLIHLHLLECPQETLVEDAAACIYICTKQGQAGGASECWPLHLWTPLAGYRIS